jgi:hypothetical protein
MLLILETEMNKMTVVNKIIGSLSESLELLDSAGPPS